METRRCSAKKVVNGETIQCEGLRGHNSAHFSENHWWANEHGLPNMTPRQSATMAVVVCGVVGVLFVLLIYFLLYFPHHR